ncbi:MAG: N-formylglutamate amidohydrolase [Rhodanobacter sp.]|nr:N-formylglutamate amidohydrolase [Rhodanobacter sp.]
MLADDEPAAFVVERVGQSPYVLICDHAGRRLPRALGDLGVSPADLQRHIAWDIGAAGMARVLAQRLDAFLITQTWSRLAIDCNRPPGGPGSIVALSENTPIPGNRDLSAHDVQQRIREIFEPYHARIHAELERRAAAGEATILVAIHSFTPIYQSVARPWHVGLLYNRDRRLAQALLAEMHSDGRWVVGDNQPYAASDATDYAIPVHGEQRGLLHVGIEMRQDLIAEAAGQIEWAERLADWLGYCQC